MSQSTYNAFDIIVTGIGVLVNVALFAFFGMQLRELRRQNSFASSQASLLKRQVEQAQEITARDHDRRSRQATIDFYATTLSKRAEFRSILPYDRDFDDIAQLLELAKQDDGLIDKEITEYLALFELLATGANTGVFDLETLRLIAKGPICAIVDYYGPWIEARRTKYGSPSLYSELETLTEALRNTINSR